ncbi:hypothetical protein F4805DRAFT_460880 [Annulohypoxylon moriforme]|nr:hypothetical protein F4805DRAFT_460880 [Annulohypoxylon moriforme]
MSCFMPECYYVHPTGSTYKLNHDKNTGPGSAFYYCSIHRIYHCVALSTHRRLPQPVCGECAWLFFQFPTEARKYPDADISATIGPDGQAMTPVSPFPRSPNGLFGQVDTTTSDPDAMDLDGPKYLLPTTENASGNLSENGYGNDRRSRRRNWNRCSCCSNSSVSSQDDSNHGE